MSYIDQFNQMYLLHHGGYCCGIRELVGFYKGPTDILSPFSVDLPKIQEFAKNGTKLFYAVDRNSQVTCPVFKETMTAEERLSEYLKTLDQFNPSGLVSCALTDQQYLYWHDTLTKYGFKVASEFKNSNTLRTIRSYHLIFPRVVPVEESAPVKKVVRKKVATAAPFSPTSIL